MRMLMPFHVFGNGAGIALSTGMSKNNNNTRKSIFFNVFYILILDLILDFSLSTLVCQSDTRWASLNDGVLLYHASVDA